MKRYRARRFAQLAGPSLFAASLSATLLVLSPQAFAETLTVADLAEKARAENSSVVSARVAERESRARLLSAKAAGRPTLSVDGRTSWAANPADAVTVSAGAFGSLPVPSPKSPTLLPSSDVIIADAQDPFAYSAAVSLDQPLWTWGKTSAAEGVRERELALSLASSERTEASALADLYRTLYALSYQREALDVANAQIGISSRSLSSLAASREAGTITGLEYEDAALNAERLERSRAALADSVAKLERAALRSAGIDAASPAGEGLPSISLDDLAREPAVARHGEADWPERALERNLDLACARLGVETRAAAADLARRQGAGKPDVALNIKAGWNGSGLPGSGGWSGSGDWFAAVTVAVKGTLIDFGASEGKIAEAEAAADRAVADLGGAESQVDAAVRGLLDDLTTLRSEADYRERVAAFRAAKAADAESRLAAGAGSEVAALQARSDLLAAVLDSSGARMHYTDACISFLLLADPEGIVSGAAMR